MAVNILQLQINVKRCIPTSTHFVFNQISIHLLAILQKKIILLCTRSFSSTNTQLQKDVITLNRKSPIGGLANGIPSNAEIVLPSYEVL